VVTTVKSFFRNWRNCLAIGFLAISLSACGGTKWGFPYRPDVQQGNWITSEQVDRLERGMTREQVRFVLGTPILQDIFRTNRWDYVFYNQPGYGASEERQFTVWFEGDVLVRWEGDKQPDRQPFQSNDTGQSSIDDEDSAAEREESTSKDNASREEKVGPDTDIGINVEQPQRPQIPGQNSVEPIR
jgi:outer membrane protein assembly factor BamE|tara:strand:- start:53394 stop:53951 length:558 start_codon:yes stop_codon:yes gene_type:complete